MKITKRVYIGSCIVVVDVVGEIVAAEDRLALNKELQEQIDEHRNIILNLENVPMMDSVSLGIFVAVSVQCKTKGLRMVLLNVSRSVIYLLLITKLTNFFDKYDDETEARKAIESALP